MNFLDELRWRGMIHDMTPGVEDELSKENRVAYIGFDPTADSLHIGSLVQIMILVHFQKAGHKPIALIGGATGMVGDPSGKSNERNLLGKEEIEANINGIQKQLEKFLSFDEKENSAEVLNNLSWFESFGFLDFIRDVGKHLSINYMMGKDSVKSRLETGMSFTEFSYQLLQGFDFLHLYNKHNCTIQLGGSDQWGNIVTGTELIRRKVSGNAFAVTTPLIKKADGSKFGKTEEGNVWLDKKRTSPYKFYQYWLNASDEDSKNYIKIFTLLEKEEIEALIASHEEAPHMRLLQKKVAEDITIRVHGQKDFDTAIAASKILFGKSTTEDLKQLDEDTFLNVFEGVPKYKMKRTDIENGVGIVDLLGTRSGFLSSNGEARRDIKGNAISVNKAKINGEITLDSSSLINNKYILLGKGKKNNYLVIISD